ncbi:IS629 ORF1 [Shigella flexneri]|nr:IS629 ORF1 [Shigella flexneri]
MTKNTRFSPEVRQRAVRMARSPSTGSPYGSMSGIPGAVMEGSPPLNVSV